jgi:hypothetical protein
MVKDFRKEVRVGFVLYANFMGQSILGFGTVSLRVMGSKDLLDSLSIAKALSILLMDIFFSHSRNVKRFVCKMFMALVAS